MLTKSQEMRDYVWSWIKIDFHPCVTKYAWNGGCRFFFFFFFFLLRRYNFGWVYAPCMFFTCMPCNYIINTGNSGLFCCVPCWYCNVHWMLLTPFVCRPGTTLFKNVHDALYRHIPEALSNLLCVLLFGLYQRLNFCVDLLKVNTVGDSGLWCCACATSFKH